MRKVARRAKAEGKQGRYHHGDLRRALLEAALELIRAEGQQALTLREVARRAGVTHAAPYRHFRNKEALLAAVAEEGFREMAARMREAQAGRPDTPLERLRAAGVGYVLYAVEHPAHFRVMFSNLGLSQEEFPALAEAGATTFGMLLDALTSAQAAGQVRTGPPHSLALSAWSMVHGLASLTIENCVSQCGPAQVSPRELALQVTEDLMRGLHA